MTNLDQLSPTFAEYRVLKGLFQQAPRMDFDGLMDEIRVGDFFAGTPGGMKPFILSLG
jgi:hypothetical protein